MDWGICVEGDRTITWLQIQKHFDYIEDMKFTTILSRALDNMTNELRIDYEKSVEDIHGCIGKTIAKDLEIEHFVLLSSRGGLQYRRCGCLNRICSLVTCSFIGQENTKQSTAFFLEPRRQNSRTLYWCFNTHRKTQVNERVSNLFSISSRWNKLKGCWEELPLLSRLSVTSSSFHFTWKCSNSF